MIKAYSCVALWAALDKLKDIISYNEQKGQKTVIFCEDRLSLAAERTVCAAVGGSILTSVYTFARFLSSEKGKNPNLLSSQGSAMAVRKLIDENKDKLTLFKKLSAASAAQSVYDTIALLYSSRITAEQTARAAERGGILGGKLKDIAVIYSAYEKYLAESGKEDRNGYLAKLGKVIEESGKIKGNAVVFLGFQALTTAAVECARSAFSVAADVYGVFVGGAEDLYVNEACTKFTLAAKDFGGAELESVGGSLNPEAEILRRHIFNPESFYEKAVPCQSIHIIEAADGQDELEFIAARIKKHVEEDRERYAKISVMLPNIDSGVRALSRVFSAYKIPFYADRRFSLAEHPLCSFIINYLLCVLSGCRPQDVDAVISSPYFPAKTEEKDVFRNYALRLANWRGGVKKQPSDEIFENFKFDKEVVERVRKTFLDGLSKIDKNRVNSGICGGLRELLTLFDVQNRLEEIAKNFKDEKPMESQFCLRAFDSVNAVIDEAEGLAGEVPLSEFIKILKSGFSAMKISLIPPKADAVFVGDIAATANTGSNVVFAARLTSDIPATSADTALLTDRDIAMLEEIDLDISPKIGQVNARRRETCALNICSFRKNLYLSYPANLDGEECSASEIISYASAIFLAPSGNKLSPVTTQKIERSFKAAPYYCSEPLPAIKRLQKFRQNAEASAIYEVLKNHNLQNAAERGLKKRVRRPITCGKRLYLNYGSLSPTALENYFSCPYLGFMRQGLKVKEREEGCVRPIDTGNFIHAVLQDVAAELTSIESDEKLREVAEDIARKKLEKPPYSSLTQTKSGQYTADVLVGEAVEVSSGMYEQLANSRFRVLSAESKCEIELTDGIKLFGRIDRVDESGDMVRIIDYKTGTVDASAPLYYTGLKLQLPLYLSAVSKGKRAAGAYYFPAAVEYTDKKDGVFRLQGFMDGSEEVVCASDKTVSDGEKSRYVNAYLNGRSVESSMPSEQFADFIAYSRLVAGGGAKELLAGNINPSPAEGTCTYCPAGGSCGFAAGRNGEERKAPTIKCSTIAAIARGVEGEKDE